MNEKRGDVMSTLEWSRSDDEGCEFVGREPDTPTVDKVKKIIINALENKNYDWRTIDGIVRETALPAEEVRDMIKKLAEDGIVVRVPYTAENGTNIYTTRKHYHETIGLLGRLISALTDRII